jgi:hypothetical protein
MARVALRALVWSAVVGAIAGGAIGVLLVLLNEGSGDLTELLALGAWCAVVGAATGVVLGTPAGPVVGAVLHWSPPRPAGAMAVLAGLAAVAVWTTLLLLALGWGPIAAAYGAWAVVPALGPVAATVRRERRRTTAVSR